MMRYYRDTDGVYYYLRKPCRKVYDDQIVEPMKDLSDEAGASGTGLLSAVMKTYLDELVRKILEDNQVREERIMAHIESVAKE